MAKNCADIRFYENKKPELENGVRFYFKTFGFPVEAQVVKFVPPMEGKPARLAWHGWSGEEKLLNVSMYIMHGYWRIFPATGY